MDCKQSFLQKQCVEHPFSGGSSGNWTENKKKLYLGWLCVLCFRKTQISAKNTFFSRAKLL